MKKILLALVVLGAGSAAFAKDGPSPGFEARLDRRAAATAEIAQSEAPTVSQAADTSEGDCGTCC